MNERINELVKQTLDKKFSYTWTTLDYQDLEKFSDYFAKLLIKECALVAALFSIEKNDIHPDIKWDDMSESAKTVNHTTCQQVAQKIREHFGVE